MENGKEELINVAREIEELATNNPCGASESVLISIARGLRALIRTKVKTEVSREEASRILGVSTRTFRRLVVDGKIPKGYRNGHKELSWYVEDLKKK
ncbi:MAG: helix-turn-helix domain-containing protein [Paludibacteraceae bacterium]|nr:helix-turn-helix domain-containing protein [Paludibacteraceae bacterium]